MPSVISRFRSAVNASVDAALTVFVRNFFDVDLDVLNGVDAFEVGLIDTPEIPAFFDFGHRTVTIEQPARFDRLACDPILDRRFWGFGRFVSIADIPKRPPHVWNEDPAVP